MERKIYAELWHNCRLTVYPDGSITACAADNNIFREPGWEESDKWDTIKEPKHHERDKAEDIERAQRRARKRITELARSNPDLEYFVTLTLDKQRADRYDIAVCGALLRNWLNNNVKRKGLKYIVIPEYHKDGAIHFHGLFNDALELVDSGTIIYNGGKPRKPRSKKQRTEWLSDGGHIVYNLPSWGNGFSTAIRLYGDRRAAIAYVCKYIGKGEEKIGGRWYLSGGKLDNPTYVYTDIEWKKLETWYGEHLFTIPRLGVKAASIELDGGTYNALVEPC